MDDADSGTGRTRARDHLANERTYLSWLRTAGAVMVLGLAIAKFGDATTYTMAAGAVLVAVGMIGLVYGTARYRRINQEIERGNFATGSRWRGPVLAAIILIVAVLVALALLITGGVSGADT